MTLPGSACWSNTSRSRELSARCPAERPDVAGAIIPRRRTVVIVEELANHTSPPIKVRDRLLKVSVRHRPVTAPQRLTSWAGYQYEQVCTQRHRERLVVSARARGRPRASSVGTVQTPIPWDRLIATASCSPASCYRASVTAETPTSPADLAVALRGCACKLRWPSWRPVRRAGVAPAMARPPVPLRVGAAEGDDSAVLRLDDERALVADHGFFPRSRTTRGTGGRIVGRERAVPSTRCGGRPCFAAHLAACAGEGLDLPSSSRCCAGFAEWPARCVLLASSRAAHIDDPVPNNGPGP